MRRTGLLISRWWTAVVVVLLATAPGLWACPNCKEPQYLDTGKMNPSSLAFNWSILFMLAMPMLVAGFLVWLIVQTCRDLDRRQQARA
jgi:hypothetical protein